MSEPLNVSKEFLMHEADNFKRLADIYSKEEFRNERLRKLYAEEHSKVMEAIETWDEWH